MQASNYKTAGKQNLLLPLNGGHADRWRYFVSASVVTPSLLLLCHCLALRFPLAAQLVGGDAGLFPLGLAALLETLFLHLVPLFECRLSPMKTCPRPIICA